jgi:hypothetical protein
LSIGRIRTEIPPFTWRHDAQRRLRRGCCTSIARPAVGCALSISECEMIDIGLRNGVTLIAVAVLVFSKTKEIPGVERSQPRNQIDSKATSIHRLLGPSDYVKFRVGRSKRDILDDVQWRGNVEMSCRLKGKSIFAVSFDLFSDGPTSGGGEVVWAIFIDDKFDKFVRWPKWEMQLIEHNGSTRSEYKPIKLGDFHRLLHAAESQGVTIEDLEKEFRAEGRAPCPIDPGLTIAYLLLRATVLHNVAATQEDYERNTSLRDRFNASRIDLGMTESQVETIFRAKPIRTDAWERGTFSIYGNRESFKISASLHYSNVIVLYEYGKVCGVYSGETVPGGDRGLNELPNIFVDLAARRRAIQK